MQAYHLRSKDKYEFNGVAKGIRAYVDMLYIPEDTVVGLTAHNHTGMIHKPDHEIKVFPFILDDVRSAVDGTKNSHWSLYSEIDLEDKLFSGIKENILEKDKGQSFMVKFGKPYDGSSERLVRILSGEFKYYVEGAIDKIKGNGEKV